MTTRQMLLRTFVGLLVWRLLWPLRRLFITWDDHRMDDWSAVVEDEGGVR